MFSFTSLMKEHLQPTPYTYMSLSVLYSRWMLDEFVVDDMVVYLEANFCLPDMQMCDKVMYIYTNRVFKNFFI